MVECTLNLIAIFGGPALTVAVGGAVGYFSARAVGDRIARKTAASGLHAAFMDVLLILRAADGPTRGMSRNRVIEALAAQTEAMGGFASHLSGGRSDAYTEECSKYHSLVRAHQTSDRPDLPTKKFIAHIESILKFTKI